MKRCRENLSEDRLIRRSKNSAGRREINLEESVPVDLIFEILSRLPAKSIAICRCVSKLWKSMILRPYFTELFLTRSRAHPQVLFASRSYKNGKNELLFFSAPQRQNPAVNSSPIVAANYHMKFLFDDIFRVCVPVNGLVCVITKSVVEGKQETVHVIFNPSTGESLTLPKLKTRKVGVRSLFGYDPTDKQFKVMTMTSLGRCGLYHEHQVLTGRRGLYQEHQVLTLGTGNLSWRKIKCCISHTSSYCYPPQEICINGVLYYSARNGSLDEMIACFDVRSEKFSFIKFKETSAVHRTLTNYNGKLALLFSEGTQSVCKGSRSLELWVLEDFEKQEWSEHIYILPALWKNVVDCTYLSFVGVSRTNEIVLRTVGRYSSFCFFYYNIERSTFTRVEIQGVKANDEMYTFLDHVEDVTPMQVLN